MEQIDAGRDVEGRVGKRQRLGVLDGEGDLRDVREPLAREPHVGRREIDAVEPQIGVGLGELMQRAPGAAGNVEQAQMPGAPRLAHEPRHRRNDLTAHDVGGAAKQELDAEFVHHGGVLAEVAIGLPVKRAAVVGRVALLVDDGNVAEVVRPPAAHDVRRIAQELRQRAHVAPYRDVE